MPKTVTAFSWIIFSIARKTIFCQWSYKNSFFTDLCSVETFAKPNDYKNCLLQSHICPRDWPKLLERSVNSEFNAENKRCYLPSFARFENTSIVKMLKEVCFLQFYLQKVLWNVRCQTLDIKTRPDAIKGDLCFLFFLWSQYSSCLPVLTAFSLMWTIWEKDGLSRKSDISLKIW